MENIEFKQSLTEIYRELMEYLDWDSFRQLNEDTNLETVLKIMARFQVTLNQGVSITHNALSNNDAESVWKFCHKVSSTAELIGFKEYSRFTKELCIQIKSNPEIENFKNEIIDLCNLTGNLEKEIERACPNLKDYLI